MSSEYEERKQFVILRLDTQLYGIDIQNVQIIERVKSIMRVPKTPPWIKGVMNLRGEIIPVIDIRMQFDMPPKENDESSRIIIIKIDENMVGIIVDSVKEVIEIQEIDVEQVQNLQGKMNGKHIQGVAKVKEQDAIVTLLNLQNIVDDAFEIQE